jgi:hypothetical protein
MKVRLCKIDINNESLELVLGVLAGVPEDGFEDDPSPLLFNYTNMYIVTYYYLLHPHL